MRQHWIYVNGEAINAEDFQREPVADYHVMDDIAPYRSMCDGSIIASRSMHREHLKAHGVIEIGNEVPVARPKDLRNTGVKQELVRSIQQAKEKYGARHVERSMADALNTAHELRRHRR